MLSCPWTAAIRVIRARTECLLISSSLKQQLVATADPHTRLLMLRSQDWAISSLPSLVQLTRSHAHRQAHHKGPYKAYTRGWPNQGLSFVHVEPLTSPVSANTGHQASGTGGQVHDVCFRNGLLTCFVPGQGST